MDTQPKASTFEDDQGNTSSMRIMCFLSLLFSAGAAAVTLFSPSAEGIYITTAFLTGAFAPKAAQKLIENMPIKK